MRALCWHSSKDIRCDEVPDPTIEHPRDAIVKVTSCAICGSDLHLYDGYMPGMERGDILGHEFMGEVVEVGPESRHALKVGDRVVIPFTTAASVSNASAATSRSANGRTGTRASPTRCSAIPPRDCSATPT